jgi:GH25 family lysozyme M1 (1,4-beta-N-acetylmuramidase)
MDGFDVSKWQPPTSWDWAALKAHSDELLETHGRRLFIVCRASYGSKTLDKSFPEYAELIRRYGFVLGAYHFYRQTQPVEEQMAAWELQMKAIGGLQPGEMFPVLDMEENTTNGDGPVNKRLWNRACDEIGDAWKARYGGCILYYSSFFPDMLGGRADPQWEWMEEEDYYHWLADYGAPEGKPREPYFKAEIHQPKPQSVLWFAKGKAPVDCDFLAPGVSLETLLIPATLEKPYDDGAPFVQVEDDPYAALDSALEAARLAASRLRR